MWYLGPLRWPPLWIWTAAATLTVVVAALALLGVGSRVLDVILGIVLVVVLLIAARNTLARLGGPGALGKPGDDQ
jgi:uncharacterized membrane protein YfcA